MGRVMVSRTVAAAALLLATAAGCSSGHNRPTPRAASSAQAAAHSAGVAAQEAFDRYSSGDFAGAWETYTDEGRAAISQDDFVKFNTECPPKILHNKVSVVGARLENSTTAVVRVRSGETLTAYTLRYERGHWRLQPSPDATALWKLGVDKAVAQEKAAGRCGGPSTGTS